MAGQQTGARIGPKEMALWRAVVGLTRRRYPDLTNEQLSTVAAAPIVAELDWAVAVVRAGGSIDAMTPAQREERRQAMAAAWEAAYAATVAA